MVREITGSLSVEFQGRRVDFTAPWKRLRIPELVADIFGSEYEHIDRKGLEERIDSDTSDEKLSFIGINRDEFRAELRAEKLGALVLRVIESELERSGRLWEPCFLCDHPRDISPLTKVKRGNHLFVERFEPHAAGYELGNAYSELTDPVEQYERFLAQRSEGPNKEYEDHPVDMDFIHAIGCGMPPTGGVGYGIDRLIMILTGRESIRDVIPFPMRIGKGEK